MNYKVKVTYATRVRNEDGVEIRMETRKRNAKVISNIVAAKQHEENNIRYEEKLNKRYVALFNFYLLTKQTTRANQLIDELLVKAKKQFA